MLTILLLAGLATADPLYENNKWFELRRATPSHPLHQAAVACAFRQGSCEKLAQEALAAAGTNEEKCKARDLLEDHYFVTASFTAAAQQIEAGVRECGSKHDPQNLLAMARAWAAEPAMSVVSLRPTSVTALSKNGFIPVHLDGKPYSAFVDTAANLSVISASAAKRLGLKLLSSAGARFGDSTGNGLAVPAVAIARTLRIGEIELANVPFAVVPDTAPPFRDWSKGKRCLIGIQVLAACRSMRWSGRAPRAKLELAGPTLSGEPNLAFQGMTPVVEATVGSRSIELVVDTGASGSHFDPKFARDFPELAGGPTGSLRFEGLGGSTTLPTKSLVTTTLRLGGKEFTIAGTQIYLEGGLKVRLRPAGQ